MREHVRDIAHLLLGDDLVVFGDRRDPCAFLAAVLEGVEAEVDEVRRVGTAED